MSENSLTKRYLQFLAHQFRNKLYNKLVQEIIKLLRNDNNNTINNNYEGFI